jgi:hypothetical protein
MDALPELKAGPSWTGPTKAFAVRPKDGEGRLATNP